MPDNYVEDPSLVPSVGLQDSLEPVAFPGAGVGAIDPDPYRHDPHTPENTVKALRAQGIPDEMIGSMAVGNGMAAIRAPDGTIGYTEIENLSKAADKGFKLVKQEDYDQHRAKVEQKEQYGGRGAEAAGNSFSSVYTMGISDAATKAALGGGAPTDYHQNLALSSDTNNQILAQTDPAALNDIIGQHATNTAKRQEVDTRYREYKEGLSSQNRAASIAGGLAGVLAPSGVAGLASGAGKAVQGIITGSKLAGIASKVGTEAAIFAVEQSVEQAQIADRPLMVSSVMANMGENFLLNLLVGGTFTAGAGLLGKLVSSSRNASRLAQNLLDVVPGETPAEQLERSYKSAQEVSDKAAPGALKNLQDAIKNNEIRKREAAKADTSYGEAKDVANNTRPRYDIEEKVSHQEAYAHADTKIRDILKDIQRADSGSREGRDLINDLEYADENVHYGHYGNVRGKLEPPRRTDIPESVAKAETGSTPEVDSNLTNPGTAKAKAQQATGESNVTPLTAAVNAFDGVGGLPSDKNLDIIISLAKKEPKVPEELISELEKYKNIRREGYENQHLIPSLQEKGVNAAYAAKGEANDSYDAASQEKAVAQGIGGAVSDFAEKYKPPEFYGPKEVHGLVGAAPGPAKGILGLMAQSAGRGVGWAAGHAVGGGMFGGLAAAHYFGNAAKKLIDVNTAFGQLLRKGVASIGIASSKGAQVATAAGIKATRAGIISGPFGADKNKTYQRQAAEAIDNLTLAANNPAALEGRMQDALTGLRSIDPKLADAVMKQVSDSAKYIADKAPKPPEQGQSILPQFKWQPTDAEVSAFSHTLEAAQNPLVIIDQIKRGTIMPETIDAVEKLHPDVARAVKEEIILHLTEVKELPYKSRLALYTWLGLPLDPTLTPVFAAGMKAVWATKPNEPQKSGGFTAPTNPQKMSSQYATQTAKLQ